MKWDINRTVIMAFLQKLVLGVLFWLGAGLLAHADTPLELGLQAYRNGNNTQAEKYWLDAAELGSHAAEFYLSVLYGQQGGDEANRQRSIEWLTRSATSGFAPAQFNLGNHLMQGRWVPQDQFKARYWWQLASEHGWEGAQYNLGLVYLKGIGVERNLEQAEYWLEKAATSGSNEAKKLLQQLSSSTETMEKPSVETGAEEISSATPDQKWVDSQNSAHLTIQLLALQKLDACLSELNRIEKKFKVKPVVYRYLVNDQAYCALLVGSYANTNLARQAVFDLPKSLKDGGPWIRPFATLQKLAK